MDCRKVSALLSPYLDGELEPSEKNFVSNHLKNCSACRRELAELQAAVQIFRQLPELAPGPAFRPRLRERLARESRSLPAGVSGSPAAFPNGEQVLPSAPRFPVPKAPATPSGESRKAPRRAGLRAVSGLFRSGGRIWPRLAVAALLLLAMGITSLWYGLAGPGLVPELPVGQVAGLPSQPKSENLQGGRAEPAGSPEGKASDAAGDDLSVVSSPEVRQPGLLAPAPQGVPAPEQAPEDGRSAAKKYPAENQKDNAGRQKIFLTAFPAPSESAPEPAAAAAAAREKENPADPGTAPKEEKPAAPPVGQGKGEDTAGVGAMAVGAPADQAAPPQKLARRVKIELTGADAQKLAPLLAQFARPEEKAATPDPAASGFGPDSNSLAARVEAAKMTEFLAQLKLLGKILRQEETGQDLTAAYARLETELKQKQLRADELQKVILAQNKNNRSARDIEDPSSLAEELKKIQTEIQDIQEELQRKDEELKTVTVEIYWRK
ncbi:MAG: DUF4349 domain-containing protein [Armatimonadetes bacterium]|nr:DUF4349 domain-containing protein [Armatimonadota bacterium]